MQLTTYTYSTYNGKDFTCFVNPIVLNSYCMNEERKLKGMVDKLLLQFGGIEDKDKDDFYSIANEVLFDVMRRYDGKQQFEPFLYACLDRKIKTEMTRRNRKKREADRMSVSFNTPIGEQDGLTLGETLAAKFDIEKEVFGEKEEEYSDKMIKYLNRLSNVQKEMLRLIIAGYLPKEIKKELKLSDKEYNECELAIHSYRNVSILF